MASLYTYYNNIIPQHNTRDSEDVEQQRLCGKTAWQLLRKQAHCTTQRYCYTDLKTLTLTQNLQLVSSLSHCLS